MRQPIHEERRYDRRYDIELDLRYKMLGRSRASLQGAGKTTNMSSGGVLFRSEDILPAGTLVELSIAWPVLLQNTCPLTLMVMGRIVRCDDRGIAVKTTRYEFLTRSARTQPHTAAQIKGQTYIA